MDRDTLLAFVRFHAWANDRILTTAAGLSDAEFRRAANLDHGSAFTTLRHLVDVDWSWRSSVSGTTSGKPMSGTTASCSMTCRPSTRSVSRRTCLRTYVESLDDAALAESLAMSADFAAPRWLVLAHVVNHGTQHRSELARYLTECGHSPGDLELLDALELRWPGDAV